jgi:hypothetical protein
MALTTFCSREAVFGHVALLNNVAVASTRELHNFHASTSFLSMRSTELRDLLEGCTNAQPMREAMWTRRERRTLSRKAKGFARCQPVDGADS